MILVLIERQDRRRAFQQPIGLAYSWSEEMANPEILFQRE